MPRLVVPIFCRPGAFSLASSIIRWYGRITCARLETKSCPSRIDPKLVQLVDLFQEGHRVQHHAVADDRTAVRPQHPAGHQLQNELLARG